MGFDFAAVDFAAVDFAVAGFAVVGFAVVGFVVVVGESVMEGFEGKAEASGTWEFAAAFEA